jgi:hypothetical protein
MENELIRFDCLYGDCVRVCQSGWKRGYGNTSNKGFSRYKLVFGLKVQGMVACKQK